VARELDITIPTVRHWLEAFPIPVRRTLGNHRVFTRKTVNHLRLVKHLRYRERYTLSGAVKQYLSLTSLRW
jgi:DNA-binding transcriptional MerR regulator